MTSPDLSRAAKHALGQLNRATEWVISWGRFVMARKGYYFLAAKLKDETGTHLWSDPILDSEDSIAVFRLEEGGYFYRLEAIFAETIDEVEYEYWVVHVSSQLNVTPVSACMFYITAVRRDQEYGHHGARRDILASDSTFIPEFRTEGDKPFRLPLTDRRVLFGLKAWEYPQCFPGSDLPATEIIALSDGTFTERRAQ